MSQIRKFLLLTLVVNMPSASAAEPDYSRDIQPLLARSCLGCHGPSKQRAGLRLDSVAAMKEGGNSGPAIVSGESSRSRLVHALTGTNDVALMPPKEPRLSPAEIALVKGWIDAGAKAPATEAITTRVTHWSFRPITRPALPSVKGAAWVRNPIDAFVLARLENEGIQASPEADRATLLRRLALDLTGLPPTPEEIDAFLQDTSPDAYERQVERLLASPHYGERWGRHWLDQARYADSNGYSIDAPRSIWPFRDWVLRALNRDLPFDQFTIEQLAGDLLPGATVDQKTATGFHRNTQINQEGGIDPEQFRVEAVVDRVNTTGSVWLGLTVACCQCHNHKFDPLSQKDYYQLFAFFNSQDEPNLSLEPAMKAAVPAKGRMGKPGGLTTMVLREREQPRETHLLLGGDFTRKGERITSGTPRVLPTGLRSEGPPRSLSRLDLAKWLVAPENPLTARVIVNRIWGQYFGVALVETENDFGTQGTPPSHPELLDWLADQFRGTTDAGRADSWSLKRLHRLVVTSATYRQSSNARPDLSIVDPRNRLLARRTRQRLEAEVVRDVCLTAAGLLDRTVGGPGVFPPQPDGVDRFTQVKRPWTASEGNPRYRRGMYTHFWRASPHPALTVFDAPDAGTACTRRNRSNTPLQALTLLNDVGFAEYAYGLAARLLGEGETSTKDRVRRAFRLCLGRAPAEAELQRLSTFLTVQEERCTREPETTAALLKGGGPAGKRLREIPGGSEPSRAALVLLARVMLNLDEVITRE